ncbi:MAG: tail fiber protein [Sphingopyxis sp.]|nr:tail fiber protein [Sphingopyxis sp.]
MSATAVVLAFSGVANPAAAQDNYIGQILRTGYTFCPIGTVAANGALLSIAQESTLFNLIGTTYGGDGQTTFAVPDYRGRVSLHEGQGPGLTNRVLGEVGGTETNTMTLGNMPRHEHTALFRTTSQAADSTSPVGNVLATTPANKYASAAVPASQLMNRDLVIVGSTGSSQPWSHLPPTLTLQYCVVTQGIYPSTN